MTALHTLGLFHNLISLTIRQCCISFLLTHLFGPRRALRQIIKRIVVIPKTSYPDLRNEWLYVLELFRFVRAGLYTSVGVLDEEDEGEEVEVPGNS